MTENKYPNADTSPERLAEIADIFHKIEPRMRDMMNNPDSIFPAMRDLLAMLQERDAEPMPKLAEEIMRRRLKFADVVDGQYEMLSGEEHLALSFALQATTKIMDENKRLRQQLHDQRWRDNYNEDWPEGQDADAVQWSKDGRWWRPILPLPKE